ncbi:MAG: glycosyltransferase, partial [Candidatus Krumholzibacteria bacterium]|nr:glycosyltransferase [Candidatus Krumholzibacteria bacterium]
IKDQSIFFMFVGDGATRQLVEMLSKELGLKNMIFRNPVPKGEVVDYLSIADVALIPLRKSETFKTVIPSKIFESAAMQRPILLGVDGEAKRLVSMYGAGLCFEPENERDFLAKLKELKENRGLYARLQEGCARLAADFDRKKLAREMLSVLQDAAGVEVVGRPEEVRHPLPASVIPYSARISVQRRLARMEASRKTSLKR